jgi:hypothetical protein
MPNFVQNLSDTFLFIENGINIPQKVCKMELWDKNLVITGLDKMAIKIPECPLTY